jgi:hypothetical protein
VIFTSLGLLLVALGFLLAGIAKSSVALLMVSLFVTLGAGLVLILVSAAARRIVEATGGGVAGRPDLHPVVIDLREEQAAATAAAANGRVPVVGYDDMTADQVMKLIRSGALGELQLSSLRDYEAAHQGRKTVLERLDRELKTALASR